MLCTIGSYQLTDGTISGGIAITGLRLRMQRFFDVVTLVPENLDGPDLLVVNQVYRILSYASGDDFTNVGASSNATGVVFIATGSIAADWTHGSILNALGPALLDRNKRRCDISFTVSRVHDTIKDAEDYIADHEFTVPRTGDVKLIASATGILPSTPVALIVNGVVLSMALTRQIGKFTEHSYNITGSPIFAPTPEVDRMLLETGDFILLETGDKILLEV